MRATADNPPDDVLEQLRRARARIAELETRAVGLGEYDHAVNLHRAGAALDRVLATVAVGQREEARC